MCQRESCILDHIYIVIENLAIFCNTVSYKKSCSLLQYQRVFDTVKQGPTDFFIQNHKKSHKSSRVIQNCTESWACIESNRVKKILIMQKIQKKQKGKKVIYRERDRGENGIMESMENLGMYVFCQLTHLSTNL